MGRQLHSRYPQSQRYQRGLLLTGSRTNLACRLGDALLSVYFARIIIAARFLPDLSVGSHAPGGAARRATHRSASHVVRPDSLQRDNLIKPIRGTDFEMSRTGLKSKAWQELLEAYSCPALGTDQITANRIRDARKGAKNLGSARKCDECFAQNILARASASRISFGVGKQVSIAKSRLSIFSASTVGSAGRKRANRSEQIRFILFRPRLRQRCVVGISVGYNLALLYPRIGNTLYIASNEPRPRQVRRCRASCHFG
jgi:hypothetical protein